MCLTFSKEKEDDIMSKGYVLTNRKAGNGSYEQAVASLKERFREPLTYMDVEEITDYAAFLGAMRKDDFLILAGGDGTLHHFANNTYGMELPEKVLYYPTGTGNDFARELDKHYGDPPFEVRQYLRNLPVVEVRGQKRRFLNGVGFGIDGYCTEVGDRMRQQGKKKINYTLIAIRGLLWGYPPVSARITVDGREYRYKKVWIAPTMFGKCYGGGMYPTPNQDRSAPDPKLSLMVFHTAGKLKTLMIFPSIFKGEHVKHTETVTVLEGRDIRVEFDRPSPLQIDGETFHDVTSYHALAPILAPTEKEPARIR